MCVRKISSATVPADVCVVTGVTRSKQSRVPLKVLYAAFYVTSSACTSKVVMCNEGLMTLVLPILAYGVVAVGACALCYCRCNHIFAIGLP